ncbi:MAG: transposase [Noviherbaspirillum sp.]
MPNCTVETITLGKVGRRRIEASFDGGYISSDAGVLLLRQADERVGLTRAVAKAFADGRRAASITHDLRTLLAQRIYALCCGWEDVTDHNTLRHDLALSSAQPAPWPRNLCSVLSPAR